MGIRSITPVVIQNWSWTCVDSLELKKDWRNGKNEKKNEKAEQDEYHRDKTLV